MRASIVIPTFNHAQYLGAAIDSALAQTEPCEVIVVDDGSTDDTASVLQPYSDRIVAIALPHGGPSLARNAGIDLASGEFVMLLDADDVIAPTKVEEQLAEFERQPETGWVLCDVSIEDQATGKTELASDRYGYPAMELGGWIQPLLTERNFIPIMSPLIRRSVLGDHIRFNDDLVPEDWHFWHAVSKVARVRYVPKVLATYRKSRAGRSRIPKVARYVVKNIEPPLRLNLGCGHHGTRSWHPIPGMVNLDKSMGWLFEDGLGDFVTGSVAGITVSHALMYVAIEHWPYVFGEFARVLAPGGMLRITEDDATNPESSRVGGWKGSKPAITLTDPAMVRQHMEQAGLRVFDVGATETRFADKSLCQAQHGAAPDCFWIEGVRQSAVLFSPHNDDECLFAAFTILRFRPLVVVCFQSAGDYGESNVREAESREVVDLLGGGPVEQWNGGDIFLQMMDLDQRIHPTAVFAPSRKTSHPDHMAVAEAAATVFTNRLICYHTYDASGKVLGKPVEFETGWVAHKLRALSRYKSQIEHPRSNKFFCADLYEYTE